MLRTFNLHSRYPLHLSLAHLKRTLLFVLTIFFARSSLQMICSTPCLEKRQIEANIETV